MKEDARSSETCDFLRRRRGTAFAGLIARMEKAGSGVEELKR